MRGPRTLSFSGALVLFGVVLSACHSEAPAEEEARGAVGSSGASGQGADAGGQSGFGGGQNGGQGLGGHAAGAPLGGAGAPLGGSSTASAGSGGVSGGSAGSGLSGSGGAPPDSRAGEEALRELREYLDVALEKRTPIADQPFARVPLDAAQAKAARDALWAEHVARIEATRKTELEQKAITLEGKTLKFDFKLFGQKPAGGRSLFLSLHGGGEAQPSVNDQQWENQKILYEPEEGVYLAPRAPTNTWNLWHEAHIDRLFQRLIEDLIVLQDVNPNRVYVMGYSAGGDGVYQLGPRMADFWAAAAMMAGHPNDAKPDSLRNLGFTIHVGALDSAFERNQVAAEWGGLLDALRAKDPEGYPHEVQIHAGKPHWMDLEDAVAVPWMAGFTRDPVPRRVVWLQDDIVHERSYWLAVPREEAKKATKIVATYAEQRVTLESVEGVSRVRVRLSDEMLDLDQPVVIGTSTGVLFEGVVPRTIETLSKTLEERGDPALVFPGEVEVTL